MGALQEALAAAKAFAWALLALALCVVVGWLLSGCAPLQCQTVDIGKWPHPSKPKPAGRLIVTCDKQPKVVIDADVLP